MQIHRIVDIIAPKINQWMEPTKPHTSNTTSTFGWQNFLTVKCSSHATAIRDSNFNNNNLDELQQQQPTKNKKKLNDAMKTMKLPHAVIRTSTAMTMCAASIFQHMENTDTGHLCSERVCVPVYAVSTAVRSWTFESPHVFGVDHILPRKMILISCLAE